ncbi:MAG: hypothetical protein KJ040_07610, partial [Gammaproteobacteria bacterium]|nr:hypothetical protein [Gammaproteobacteria bacterium]
MKKVLAAVALIGAVGVAQAAPATLTGVTSYSKSGTSVWTINSAGTWDVNTGTGVATQTGGTLNMIAKVGATPLMTHTMTSGVLSSGTATAASWACVEGVFGGIVGAHFCGNLNLGGNFTLDSTIGNSGTATTVVLGGDDVSLGAPQSLANSYSGLALTNLGGGNWRLSNGVVGVGGYDFNFNVVPVPAAVWLF